MMCSAKQLQHLWHQAPYDSEAAEALCGCFRTEIRHAAQQVRDGPRMASVELEVCQGLLWDLVQLHSRR